MEPRPRQDHEIVLRVKLAQHWDRFGSLLLATGQRPIVEESKKDVFWGARPVDEHSLVGVNVLGRLLMELRDEMRRAGRVGFLYVEPYQSRTSYCWASPFTLS